MISDFLPLAFMWQLYIVFQSWVWGGPLRWYQIFWNVLIFFFSLQGFHPMSSLGLVCKVNILNMITNTHKNYELSLRRLIWFVLKILKVFSCFSILALILDIKVRMIQLRWMDSEGQKEGILFWSSFSHFTNMSIHSHSSWEFALLVFIWIYIDLSLI